MSYNIEYDIDLGKALLKVLKRDAQFIKEAIKKLTNNLRPDGAIKISV